MGAIVPRSYPKQPKPQAINWSLIEHVIGNMSDGEEFGAARVQLPDGTIADVVLFERDAQGKWLLRTKPTKTEK